ncbi:MAG: Sensor histidine kinase GraS [Firmicutes bacterium ADurb.Bin506]|jgi:signal transduction histidine kinase|nr:MAG: Sensor histidine kinase GraS [Firmicutes bacterium ADurb.Bin506]
MSIRDYLAARAAFILSHLIAGALSVAVIQLDLLQTAASGLTAGSAAYIVTLHVAILVVALAVDYSLQRSFYSGAREIAAASDPLSRVPALPVPRTPEQRITSELANAAYSSHIALVSEGEEQTRLHLDFTNRWVHAMKTPVSVIDLVVQQSREVGNLDEALPLFDSIQEENEKMAHSLETMLGMARQQRFSVDLLPARVDLLDVARAVVNKHRKEFIRYSIYPDVQCTASDCVVETDEKWITFVIDQLVANAIKYTRLAQAGAGETAVVETGAPAKRVSIVVESHDAPAGQGPVTVLTVRDTGIGIPPHDLPRVFDPFFTGENGRLAPESTGVGLYLARKVCAGLGHSISASSRPGKGTEMSVTFAAVSITRGLTEM